MFSFTVALFNFYKVKQSLKIIPRGKFKWPTSGKQIRSPRGWSGKLKSRSRYKTSKRQHPRKKDRHSLQRSGTTEQKMSNLHALTRRVTYLHASSRFSKLSPVFFPLFPFRHFSRKLNRGTHVRYKSPPNSNIHFVSNSLMAAITSATSPPPWLPQFDSFTVSVVVAMPYYSHSLKYNHFHRLGHSRWRKLVSFSTSTRLRCCPSFPRDPKVQFCLFVCFFLLLVSRTALANMPMSRYNKNDTGDFFSLSNQEELFLLLEINALESYLFCVVNCIYFSKAWVPFTTQACWM